MKTKEEIKLRLEKAQEEYEYELKGRAHEEATDKAKELIGEIWALKWVIGESI
jgi:hypothetical protein